MRGIQSITGGTAYNPLDIFSFKLNPKNKLGLNFLCELTDYDNLTDKNILRNVEKTTLANKSKEEWIKIFETNNQTELKNIDIYAKEAIESFWNRYGIQLQYTIEHKV